MKQSPLFPETTPSTPVINVARVPHRSPFRYPGGKTWLIPTMRLWLNSLAQKPKELIEPFAGGAIVGLTVVFEELVQHTTLVELDSEVAAVWQTIVESNDGEWLANRIASFDFTFEAVQNLIKTTNLSLRERAFQTIIKNRINRGGILAAGAGHLKHGESGKGIRSRWYPETLKKRILDIVAIRDRLKFIQGDGLDILHQNIQCSDVAFFIDPPYTAAGKKAGQRLYTHSDLDHEELFSLTNSLKCPFLMTYDDNVVIRVLAAQYGFDTQPVAMKNTHHTRMTELLISRDLNWLR
jgi:DNA adenine methylase